MYYFRFGGGPKCTNNQLQRCEVCYAEYIDLMLRNRAEMEMKNFARLREESSLHVRCFKSLKNFYYMSKMYFFV